MTLTLADHRKTPEARGLPKQLAFKTAETVEAPVGQMMAIDEDKGIVTAVVSVTGVVDEVDDVIVPGAYRETLMKRRPKVCWAHSWEHPIGKVLYIEELMPGDERLPPTTRDGQPWPKAAGALIASMQFNLRTAEGKDAFEVVRFYSESAECEYSIGYNVPPGRAATDGKGTRFIKMLELYELSVVLFGAHTMTGTLSIKSAAAALKTGVLTGRRGVDLAVLAREVKAPVPPQFQKAEDEEKPGEKPSEPVVPAEDDQEQEKADEDCTCCAGSGEHPDGHECYVCDAAGTLAAQAEGDAGVEPGQPLVCQGHHGRSADGEENPPEGGHQPDAVSPDAAPEGTPTAGEEAPQEDGEPQGDPAAPGADTRPPAAAVADDADPADPGAAPEGAAPVEGAPAQGGEAEPVEEVPDFSDGIMVALYPDQGARDAVAAHIAGPDETTPPEDLHVTLAYLGNIGGAAPTEQEVIDAVTRAVEGQPALSGEVGGIGQFPAGDDGTPTYAPVDVPGLGLLREQIVSELGDVVFNDHGFTPHMTLGYNIGIIDPVPATPVTFTEVHVVYGNSQRGITLGTPLPESKSAAYDPHIEQRPRAASLPDNIVAAMREVKAGGADRNRGNAEELRKYWTVGEGGLKIAWDTPGDFTRCVALLDEHMPGRAEGYCANRHKEMTGMWPGDDGNKDAGVVTQTKTPTPSPGGTKSHAYMDGSYEERQAILREGIEAQYVDDVDSEGRSKHWVDLRSTWPDRVLYTVEWFGPGIRKDYLVDYTIVGDAVEFGEQVEVELTMTFEPVPGSDDEEVAFGDAFPLVEGIMGVVAAMKTAQAMATEGKAGRVLSGSNERSLRTAVEHLINVLAAAGIDLGEVSVDKPRPVGNTGSDADVRREVDPSVDLSTTSPVATTKGAPEPAEAKSLRGGEVLTIDMDAHRALLAFIDEETTEA